MEHWNLVEADFLHRYNMNPLRGTTWRSFKLMLGGLGADSLFYARINSDEKSGGADDSWWKNELAKKSGGSYKLPTEGAVSFDSWSGLGA